MKPLVDKPRVIAVQRSPNCRIGAAVEANSYCAYLYLFGDVGYTSQYTRCCFIRNFEEAPDEFEVRKRYSGIMMMPKRYCKHPKGLSLMDEEKLEFVWFEEGDGLALLYEGQIQVVMLGGIDRECPGYSRECTVKTTMGWPLEEKMEQLIKKQLNAAQQFWKTVSDTRMCQKVKDEYVHIVEKQLGKVDRCYQIDGGNWPPKSIMTIQVEERVYVFTVGVSMCRQPRTDTASAAKLRRIEFAFALKVEEFEKNKEGILSYISDQTNVPWRKLTYLAHGSLIRCDIFQGYSYMLLLNQRQYISLPRVKLPTFRGDPINVLWMVPITEEEAALMDREGTEAFMSKQIEEEIWCFSIRQRRVSEEHQ